MLHNGQRTHGRIIGGSGLICEGSLNGVVEASLSEEASSNNRESKVSAAYS